MIDDGARLDLVKSEISKLPGKKRIGSTYSMVLCPFHNEQNPSARISNNIGKPRSIGWFSCYVCGESIPWNIFSERMGLTPFVKTNEQTVPQNNLDYLNDLLLVDNPVLIKENLKLMELDDLSSEFLGLSKTNWRGFDFKFLRKIGAKCAYKIDTQRYYVWLPVLIDGNVKGYIKAMPHKHPDKNRTSYVNASGSWSKKFGLFGYDYALALMKRKGLRTIVLCEGPRDALRLLRDNIPAMCILGTQSWSKHKVLLLQKTEAKTIILCMDGDAAGQNAAKLLYSGRRYLKSREDYEQVAPPLKESFSTFTFPIHEYAKDGEKIDPFTAPENAIEDLRDLLT